VYDDVINCHFEPLMLGNLASEQPTGAQKGPMERQGVRGDCHSSMLYQPIPVTGIKPTVPFISD